MIHYFHFLL